MENIFCYLISRYWYNDGKRMGTCFCKSFSGTARSVTNLFRLERYPRTYGDDPYGTGNGSYQLRNTDYARRHTG